MAIRHQIEMFMTIALVLYSVAFVLARKKQARTHVFIALLGFLFDLYATYLMSTFNQYTTLGSQSVVIQVHTWLAILALSMFFVQAILGVATYLDRRDPHLFIKHRRRHITFAKWVFFPTWIVAYLSGGMLIS